MFLIDEITPSDWSLKFNASGSFASIIDSDGDDLLLVLKGTLIYGPIRDKFDDTRTKFSFKPTTEQVIKLADLEDHLFGQSHAATMRRWVDDEGICSVKFKTDEPEIVAKSDFRLMGRLGWYTNLGTGGLYFVTEADDQNKENIPRFGKRPLISKKLPRGKNAKGVIKA